MGLAPTQAFFKGGIDIAISVQFVRLARGLNWRAVGYAHNLAGRYPGLDERQGVGLAFDDKDPLALGLQNLVQVPKPELTALTLLEGLFRERPVLDVDRRPGAPVRERDDFAFTSARHPRCTGGGADALQGRAAYAPFGGPADGVLGQGCHDLCRLSGRNDDRARPPGRPR